MPTKVLVMPSVKLLLTFFEPLARFLDTLTTLLTLTAASLLTSKASCNTWKGYFSALPKTDT